MNEVFISHSSKDAAIATAVCHHLEAAGIRCFIAPRDIMAGELWAEAIVAGIKRCKVFVLVFSTDANRSKQVSKEISIAVASGLVIIPFIISNEKPTGVLQYYLVDTHWIDAMTPPVEAHIHQLVARTGVILGLNGDSPTAAPIPEKPLEPLAPLDNAGRSFCLACGFAMPDAATCPVCHGKMATRSGSVRFGKPLALTASAIWVLLVLFSAFILGYFLLNRHHVEMNTGVLGMLAYCTANLMIFLSFSIILVRRLRIINDRRHTGSSLAAANLAHLVQKWFRIPAATGILCLVGHIVILLLANR